MANTTQNYASFFIQGDNVALTATINLGYTPTSISFVSASIFGGADVSSNVVSTILAGSVVTVTFSAAFSYLAVIVLNIVQTVTGNVTISGIVPISGTVTTTPPANASTNVAQIAGSTLGAPSNYGTSPGAVIVPGVNAFITNTPAVTLASTTITGSVAVTQSTTPWTIQGNSASGVAKAGNPVQISGVFNTTQPTVITGQTVEAQSTARGAQIVATGIDIFNVTVNAALPTGANVIGHVIADSGSTTVVTGNVTVVQPTGTNLHVVTDSGTITTVSTVTAVTAITNALPTGANTIGKVDILGNAGATIDSTAAAGAAPTNAILTSAVFNTTVPAPTAGQALAAQADSTGSLLFSQEGRKVSYSAAYRLVDATAGQLSLTFTFVANTNKQLATIYHAAGATKVVKIHYISITPSTGAAGIFDFEVRALSATTAPATGNPAITPGKFAQADAAAEATCLSLPTTAGSLVAADSPVSGAFEWNSAAAAAIANPSGISGQEIVLFNDMMPGVKPLTMRSATAEGYAINGRCTAAVALRYTVRIVFTEE